VSRAKTWLKYIVGLALTAVLLGWVMRGTDTAAVWESLKQASLPLVILGAALNFGQNYFRVERWGALLTPVRAGIPFRPMFVAVILGYTTSWVIPGRLGELVRPALLSAREKLPLGPCLGSVAADRLLDGLGVVGLFAVGMAVTPLSGDALTHMAEIRKWSLVMVGLIAIPIALLLAISANRGALERWLGRGGRVRSLIGGFILALSRGIEGFRQPRLLVRMLFHTALAWLCIAVGTWLGIRACGAPISLGAVFVILPLLVLGIALPTPGGAGGYHAAMVFGLTRLFGVDNAVAVSAAIIVHASAILPVVLAGVAFLFVERIPFRDLVRVGRAAGGRVPETEDAS
jgi:uncharacterized protein (TIRG00374 family)